MAPKVALLFDVEGVAVMQGTLDVRQEIPQLLKHAPTFNCVVSGRDLDRCKLIAQQMGNIHALFAENGPLYQIGDMKPICIADRDALESFRKALCMQSVGDREVLIEIGGVRSLVRVEPKISIISFEPDGECRWSPLELKEMLSDIVQARQLPAEVIGPHPDGGIDVQPFSIEGRPLNKGIVVNILRQAFPWIENFVAFIDGKNDRPLALHPDVFPITFQNGDEEIKTIVSQRGGWIIPEVGYLGGCTRAIQRAISTFCT